MARGVNVVPRWLRRKRFWIPIALTVILVGLLEFNFHQPSTILLVQDTAWGLSCKRAPDLVVQGRDADGHLWATRGLWAYRLRSGEDHFVRQFRVPCGLSPYWLLNFSWVRWLATWNECVEMVTLPSGGVVAMSAGRMWCREAEGTSFRETLALPHYGVRVGRGIMPLGMARLKDGTILLGEYFRNHERAAVRVYSSTTEGRSWEVAHEFKPGEIRHVHSIQQDPYTDRAWLCAGDMGTEPRIAWSTDRGKTWNPIGAGAPQWVACGLAFTQEGVYWGTDTDSSEAAGLYRWDRASKKVTKLTPIDGLVLFATRLSNGMMVMSADREGSPLEKDSYTKLWLIADGRTVTSIQCGEWASRSRFGYMRIDATPGNTSLCFTCRNVRERDGDLLLIEASELVRVVSASSGRQGPSTKNTDAK